MDETLPQKIKDKELNLVSQQEELVKLQKMFDITEMNINLQVAQEKDTNGRNKFSNDTLRKAETTRILSTNEEVKKLDEKIFNQQKNVKLTEIEIKYLRDLFRMQLAMLNSK